MSDIRMMKLAGLLTETKLNELTPQPFDTITDIFHWDRYHLLRNIQSFDITRDYEMIGMTKSPGLLSSEDLEHVLADCDENIKTATKMLEIANKVKQQVQDLATSASEISAGELQYKDIKLTPQDILDFLKSIFIDDKANAREIYETYNKIIRNEMPEYPDLILTSPTDLVGRGGVRGGNDVVFTFKRQSGGDIVESALENSLFRLVSKDYPEVAQLLTIERRKFSFGVKKSFIVKLKRSSKQTWKRIFIKYAEWVDA